MEQVRNRKLDSLCEEIADVRRTKNRLLGEETELQRQALLEMERAAASAGGGARSYTHAGVELALVPGETHLRIRLVREQATAKDGGLAAFDGTKAMMSGAEEAEESEADDGTQEPL
jgi:hypothetical protein